MTAEGVVHPTSAFNPHPPGFHLTQWHNHWTMLVLALMDFLWIPWWARSLHWLA